jgi:hypothetical protein
MGLVIHKYSLERTDEQRVNMPRGARVLSVGIQNAMDIVVWAIVDPMQPREPRTFWVVGTGHPFPPSAVAINQFVGTVLIAGGMLVFHIFTEA